MFDIFNRVGRIVRGIPGVFQKICAFFHAAAESAADERNLYDLGLLKELEDDHYLLNMLNIFLRTIPGQLENIRQADAEGDHEKVYFLAHKLKGSAGMLQSQTLLDLLKTMERQSKERRGVSLLIEKAIAHYGKMEGPLLREKIKLESILHKAI